MQGGVIKTSTVVVGHFLRSRDTSSTRESGGGENDLDHGKGSVDMSGGVPHITEKWSTCGANAVVFNAVLFVEAAHIKLRFHGCHSA